MMQKPKSPLRLAGPGCLVSFVAGIGVCLSVTPQMVDRQVIIPVQGGKGRCIVTAGPAVPVAALAFAPDGMTLVQGGYREILMWDLGQAKLARRIGQGQIQGQVLAVTCFKDGRRMAVAEGVPGRSGAVRILEMDSGQQSRVLDGLSDTVQCLALDPNERYVAAGCADGNVCVLDSNDLRLLTTIQGHSGWVQGLAFSPDANSLASAGADKTVRVWETKTWTLKSLVHQQAPVHGVVYSPDGQSLVLAVGGPQTRAIYSQRADNPKRQVFRASTGVAAPLAVVWGQRPDRIYAACSDGTIRAIDPSRGGRQTSLEGHGDWVYALALSLDGTHLASGSADGTVKIWATAKGAAKDEILATLVQTVPGTDAWAIVTAEGFFAASSPDLVVGGAVSCNPERVRATLAGKPQVRADGPSSKSLPK